MNFLKNIVVAGLTLESRLILAKYKPFIVAVTGSVGKTSTKDAIYGVLSNSGLCNADGTGICYVRKSQKSFNSETGLPLTVIGAPNAWRSVSGWLSNLYAGVKLILFKHEYPDCLVLEIGADHPNDIKRIAAWLKPDITVITQISTTPVHVEFFKSPEEVFEEKASLATAVKDGGTLILFADNPKVLSLADRVKERGVKIISFGTSEAAQVKGGDQRFVYEIANTTDMGASLPKIPAGFTFKLSMNDASETVSINGLIGKSYMYPLLAAAAVGMAKNVSVSTIIRGLNKYDAPKGRMNIIQGRDNSTLIDDTYNSSPDAVMSALATLKELECSGSKIVALGDMMELGQYSAEEHRKVGREVLGVADVLITVGQRSRATADEAIKTGFNAECVHSFDTSVEAGEFLEKMVKPFDIILVKGSQSIRMERIVKMLMKDSSKAESLLVRQEKEWLDKK
jgi:UDP-N-acetylmuramoyl-tripeptide--D-alanyl-D-alanine ligase